MKKMATRTVVTSWGKSMYGGWYANTVRFNSDGTYQPDTIDGFRAKTQSELKKILKNNGIEPELLAIKRSDND